MKENVTKSRQKFRFSPGEFYFQARALPLFVIMRRIVPQDLLGVFFFHFNPEVSLSVTMSLMRNWSSQGQFCLREHVPIRGSVFYVD